MEWGFLEGDILGEGDVLGDANACHETVPRNPEGGEDRRIYGVWRRSEHSEVPAQVWIGPGRDESQVLRQHPWKRSADQVPIDGMH